MTIFGVHVCMQEVMAVASCLPFAGLIVARVRARLAPKKRSRQRACMHHEDELR